MKDFLDRAAKAYYDGNPIISDEEFDALSSAFSYQSVGAADGEHPHLFPMYSLQKVFEADDIPTPFLSADTIIVTPKLDGAAVALIYEKGIFVRGLTRGNGKKGRNITSLLRHLVPNVIYTQETIQITGEVVAPKTIPNARNYASGALNLKSMDEFLTRELTFVAYDVQSKVTDSFAEDMQHLSEFNTILDSNWDQFPHDGQVFRIDNNLAFEELGYTAHHPRGAFALKRKAPGVVTKLLNVIWNVGKSGVISPVAILEPVKIGEATVSKATLHNIRFIEDMNLEIGCMVEVIRSGEIIPKIVRRVS
jgi:DNA ligase (NAD+)